MRSEHTRRCGTQKGRQELARAMTELGVRHGATVAETYDRDRDIYLCLAYGPYRVMTWFDACSRVGSFGAHWFTATRSEAHYPKDFGLSIGGSINEIHFGKATAYRESFDAFLASLERGFERLKLLETA